MKIEIIYKREVTRSRETRRKTTRQLCHQGHKAAGGCKPCHSRGDRKRERSFSGLRDFVGVVEWGVMCATGCDYGSGGNWELKGVVGVELIFLSLLLLTR